ncbi:type I methionyl aminopeptidase [Limnochorda pilosa]|uniref:Methionine aminopeptidase n=1 Tax=Limnochorda pilosa TaxID=1555112 RepID=A0A0K2SPX4_LIMPI|nr:type I methionyl aminopeptidase [Limnochorda pilosa]BAS29067.1 methionine aminopeptidase [Limnochorda pilosa]
MIILKSPEEVRLLRRAGRLVAEAHARVAEMVRPGVTTEELDRAVDELIRRAGGVPTFKGYHGYPASICTSVDHEVIHGIPGPRRLHEGQIVSVDVGATLDGYVGDGAWTYPVGRIPPEVERLLEVTQAALYKGIEAARVGNRVSDIGHAVQRFVEAHGYSVVREFVGHGVGRSMHEDPQVPNYGKPGRGPRIKEGLCVAIEPMVNMGGHQVRILSDQWTAVTVDGLPSAHFEHTVIVTRDGPEILTRLD